MRNLWALLATINDLPISYEHVTPSKGYVARGSYKRFLTHSIVHLDVPTARRRKLAIKHAAVLRRAHPVRGHFVKPPHHLQVVAILAACARPVRGQVAIWFDFVSSKNTNFDFRGAEPCGSPVWFDF